MASPGLLSQKVTPLRAVVVLVALALPAFIWFRFLYVQYVVIPNQISPTMRKMRDGMMHNAQKSPPAPPASTSGPKNLPGERGDNKEKR